MLAYQGIGICIFPDEVIIPVFALDPPAQSAIVELFIRDFTGPEYGTVFEQVNGMAGLVIAGPFIYDIAAIIYKISEFVDREQGIPIIRGCGIFKNAYGILVLTGFIKM
jgi:hypothetical protein